jgi:hypothetical protein
MNLYLISAEPLGYDTYDSAIVAADTLEEARMIHPDGFSEWDGENVDGWCAATWVGKSCVEVEVAVVLIGVTEIKSKGVILASFNAG